MTRRQFLACVIYTAALVLVRAAQPNQPAPWLEPDETGYSPAEQGEVLLSLIRGTAVAGFDAGGARWTAERAGRGWRLLDHAGRVCHTAS